MLLNFGLKLIKISLTTMKKAGIMTGRFVCKNRICIQKISSKINYEKQRAISLDRKFYIRDNKIFATLSYITISNSNLQDVQYKNYYQLMKEQW